VNRRLLGLRTDLDAKDRRLNGLRAGLCGLRAGLNTVHGRQGGFVPV
jgi:hypothetical protein